MLKKAYGIKDGQPIQIQVSNTYFL